MADSSSAHSAATSARTDHGTVDVTAEDSSLPARLLRGGFPWLKFPGEFEAQYREVHRAGAHGRVRMSLIVAVITSSGFLFMDHWVIKSVNAMPEVVRFGLQFPVLLACLLATSRRFYLRWYQPAILVGLPLFGLGTVIMTAYAPEQHTALVGARLLLVSFFCYFMLGLRMRQALACNAFILASLAVVAAMGLIDSAIGWYMGFALFCANIIGAVGAYALEHADRTAFLERLSLEEMAARDGLTRLLNRQTFEFRARNLWRTGTTLQRPLSVIMVDVDYFKRFNDHYGHQAGDDCLRRVAICVRDAIAPGRDDLVARYGGEELIALLADRDAKEVEAIAAKIVSAVTALGIEHQASVVCDAVSVSVGACAPNTDANISFKHMANIADQALYAAKHQGRNRSVLLDPRHTSAADQPEEGVTRPEARALRDREESMPTGVVPG